MYGRQLLRNFVLVIVASLFFFSCKEQNEDLLLPRVSDGAIVRIENFQSKIIEPRNVDVWLPDGYSKNKKYSVLYMHDGQMLFDSSKTWNKQEWGVDETISNLIERKVIEKCIVVGIWSLSKQRHSDYTPQKPFESLPQSYQDSLIQHAKRKYGDKIFFSKVQSDNYLKFIAQELKPYMDMTFSTKADKENTFIAGSSMGGLISIYAICEYPEIFGGAACLSTHWTVTYTDQNNPIPQKILNYLNTNLPDPTTHKIYFDYGTETLDSLYEQYQKQVDMLMKENAYNENNWKTMKFIGKDHSENAWKERLYIPITFLLKSE